MCDHVWYSTVAHPSRIIIHDWCIRCSHDRGLIEGRELRNDAGIKPS